MLKQNYQHERNKISKMNFEIIFDRRRKICILNVKKKFVKNFELDVIVFHFAHLNFVNYC